MNMTRIMRKWRFGQRVLCFAGEAKAIPGLSNPKKRIKSSFSTRAFANSTVGGQVLNEHYSKLLFLRITCSLAMLTMLVGCQSSSPPAGMETTGFLSDYSHLESISSTSRRYINPKYDLGHYTKFIIDRVEMLVELEGKDGIESWDELEKLRAYLRRAIVFTVEPRYKVVSEPGPGVARVRIALTEVKGSVMSDVGSVSMEAEILDSRTGEQIAAIVESEKRGSRLVSENSGKWNEVESIMDMWAKRFYARLKEAHRR